jgi:predicted transcriptional regulator
MASAATGIEGVTVGTVMRRRWIAVSPLAPLRDALRLMRMARLRQLPVASDGILRGVIGYHALVHAVLDSGGWELAPVAQVMSPEAETGEVGMPIAEAAARMVRSRAGCLPVVEPAPGGARLVGLVTETDLLRLAYAPARVSASA